MYTGRTSVLNVIHEPQSKICTSVSSSTGVKLILLWLRTCQTFSLFIEQPQTHINRVSSVSSPSASVQKTIDAKANSAVRANREDYLPDLNLSHPSLFRDLLGFMARAQLLMWISSTSSRSVCFLPPSSAASRTITALGRLSNANWLNVVV